MDGVKIVWLLLLASLAATASETASSLADRTAIERVYYNHRLGEKPSFADAVPTAVLTNLVQQDTRKQAVLKKVYGIEVTAGMLEGEVQRINLTTRAPEMLAEIKSALGNDPQRFANAFAKPILIDRLLRDKFDNDDALHAPQRREIESVRTGLTNAAAAFRSTGSNDTKNLARKLLALLKQSHSNSVTEITWQLGVRAAETKDAEADLLEVQKRFGPNAQILSSPRAEEDQKLYFADLPVELQNVLRVQLRGAGDVSAVIETPAGFLLYVAKEKTETRLSVGGLSLPKRSYEQWLQQQTTE